MLSGEVSRFWTEAWRGMRVWRRTIMVGNDTEVDRRPGAPVDEQLPLEKEEIFRRCGLDALAFRRRLLISGGVFSLVLFLLGFQAPEERPEATMPHVSEIAPALSLPLEVNQQVEHWMERYLTDQRRVFEWYLEREGLYSDMIRTALRSRGMPEDLIYLAAIESGFTPVAISPVAATGMWQFMLPTAEGLGLRIDEYVDERRDPVRATEAALEFLQYLYDRFGSWYLAAAAYNAGPARVEWAVRTHRGDGEGEDVYWEILDRLPLETRVYVPKILAAILLAQEAEEYGFDVVRADPVEFERVWVPGGTTLATVAKAVDVPVARIRELNPHLLRGVTPPGEPFGIRVPPGRSPMVVAFLGNRWRTVNADN